MVKLDFRKRNVIPMTRRDESMEGLLEKVHRMGLRDLMN